MEEPADRHDDLDDAYRIHLHGPWQIEWLDGPAQADPFPPAASPDPRSRVRFPCDWQAVFGDTAGRVRLRRVFHRPTNLDEWEQVYLVFEDIAGTADAVLNGEQLGQIPQHQTSAQCHVTELLQSTNELVLEVQLDAGDRRQQRPLTGTVAIEIRSEWQS